MSETLNLGEEGGKVSGRADTDTGVSLLHDDR